MSDDLRVLHVDDEQEFADLTVTYLQREDGRFSVETAASGAEGLDRLTDDLDCVVSDYDMPGMTGIEFLRSVREEYPDLPFVLFTGKGSEEVASEAISAGVTDYLRKRSGTEQYELLATRIGTAVGQYRAEQELERQNDLFAKVQDLADVGAWEWRPPEGTGDISEQVYEIYGIDSHEEPTPASDIREFYHPDDRETIREAFGRAVETGEPYDVEVRVITPDGTTKWVRTRGDPQFEDGTCVRVRGSIQDITERKERERDLEHRTERLREEVERRKRAESRYRSLFENFPEPTLAYSFADGEPHVARVNDAFTEVFGYTREEAVGTHVDDLVVPPDRMSEARRLDERIRAGHAVDEELTRQTSDGRNIFRLRNISLLEDDEIDGYAIYADISEYKHCEQELERIRRRYRSLFEANPVVIWEEDFSAVKESLDELAAEVDDVETYLVENPEELHRLLSRIEVIDVNRNALDYYEAPSKEVLMDNLGEVFTEEAQRTLTGVFASFARGETHFRGETVARTLSGDRKHELLEIFVPGEYMDEDDYSRVFVTGMDITDRKRQEQELRRKNERLEQFASVVSHDLRNPLTVLDRSIVIAEETGETEHFRRCRRAVERMERLIEDLLTIAREGDEVEEMTSVSLAEVSENCWEFVATAEATLAVEAHRTVRADRGRLAQLLENLFRNAIQHGGEGVTITVGDLEDGFYVADDGPGIPPADSEAVFEFGYSTTAEGTGFGLNIVEAVADAHGWSVRVDESAAGGARFEITGVE